MEVKWKMVIRWQYRRCYKGIGQNEKAERTAVKVKRLWTS